MSGAIAFFVAGAVLCFGAWRNFIAAEKNFREAQQLIEDYKRMRRLP